MACRRAFTAATASGEQDVVHPSSSWTGTVILMLVCEGEGGGLARGVMMVVRRAAAAAAAAVVSAVKLGSP